MTVQECSHHACEKSDHMQRKEVITWRRRRCREGSDDGESEVSRSGGAGTWTPRFSTGMGSEQGRSWGIRDGGGGREGERVGPRGARGAEREVPGLAMAEGGGL
ncbi:hypothetical protein M758_3G255200 [Ceratodon purpureus]|uniref:Uncharacterized protein n=1 Tax=Ceratodon purpureus TaxID=3225 RepID=A0A8T0IQI5_CERPU|nr:hypothetical protein KC19_3G254600 [Ceratodon purpureus]KAG0624540.1 hypothetical protein M758_3G255200 [Ceratodon purpureus]